MTPPAVCFDLSSRSAGEHAAFTLALHCGRTASPAAAAAAAQGALPGLCAAVAPREMVAAADAAAARVEQRAV